MTTPVVDDPEITAQLLGMLEKIEQSVHSSSIDIDKLSDHPSQVTVIAELIVRHNHLVAVVEALAAATLIYVKVQQKLSQLTNAQQQEEPWTSQPPKPSPSRRLPRSSRARRSGSGD